MVVVKILLVGPLPVVAILRRASVTFHRGNSTLPPPPDTLVTPPSQFRLVLVPPLSTLTIPIHSSEHPRTLYSTHHEYFVPLRPV